MELNPIQAAITAIEEEAARQTANLLKIQDDYLLTLQLVDMLKQHSQPESCLETLQVNLVDHGDRTGMNIYGHHTSPSAINDALLAADIPVELMSKGYNEAVRCWHVAGYPLLQLYMPASITPLAFIKQPEAA